MSNKLPTLHIPPKRCIIGIGGIDSCDKKSQYYYRHSKERYLRGGLKMGGCRQTYSLWFFIKKVFRPYSKYYGRWKSFKDLCKMDVSNSYFWHDSFGKFINKFILCKLIGHRHVQWLSDGSCSSEKPKHYCFNCECEVNPGIDNIKNITGECSPVKNQ